MIQRLLILSLPIALSASLLDFRLLNQAQEAYQEGNYTATLNAYKQIDNKSDEIRYDQANSHYKLGAYDQALKLYKSIKKPQLTFRKWHNMGNCYAQLGRLDEGINAYEEALKIQEDKDTRFNLELLKKRKKEQEQKRKDKNQQNKNQNKKDQDQKQQNKNQKENKDQDQKQQNQKDKNQQKKDQKDQEQKQQNQKDQKEKNQQEKNRQPSAQQPIKKEPISDRELRKYQKMLDRRGINTLMLPLKTKGEQNEELKPW
jgi:Ca-activated chloride channel family protein